MTYPVTAPFYEFCLYGLMGLAVIKGERHMFRVDGSLARTLEFGETTVGVRVGTAGIAATARVAAGPRSYHCSSGGDAARRSRRATSSI